jgi:hypothetical protein
MRVTIKPFRVEQLICISRSLVETLGKWHLKTGRRPAALARPRPRVGRRMISASSASSGGYEGISGGVCKTELKTTGFLVRCIAVAPKTAPDLLGDKRKCQPSPHRAQALADATGPV